MIEEDVVAAWDSFTNFCKEKGYLRRIPNDFAYMDTRTGNSLLLKEIGPQDDEETKGKVVQINRGGIQTAEFEEIETELKELDENSNNRDEGSTDTPD
jgi:hypothetical protein